MPEKTERDLRKYARSTNSRLIVGALILLFLIGDGLVALIYGVQAGGFALLCTATGLLPLGLIVIWLWLIEKFARRLDDG